MKRLDPQTRVAIGVLGLLAVVAIVTAKSESPPAAIYASTDYSASGYRAWATLLAREGVRTQRFVLRPIELDDRIDTLISAAPPLLAGDPAARTDADIGALATWVRGGGRLVYIGRNLMRTAAEDRSLELPFLLPAVGARGALRGPAAPAVPALADLGIDRMLLAEHAGTADLADGNGDIVVRYALGRGQIVAVVDPVPFTNAALARDSNARLAYLLGRPRRLGAVVAFDDGVHGALVDRPWYRALSPPVRVGLGIAAVAIALMVAGGALPGIPAMRAAPAREPSSVEFVAALAALYERTGARTAMRDVLANAALAGAGATDSAARARLADTLTTPVSTDADLLATAKLVYLVRKESTHGGNGDGRRAAFAGRTRSRRRR